MARRDPDYKFVLAELDYLKPYWDAYPEDRAYIRAAPGRRIGSSSWAARTTSRTRTSPAPSRRSGTRSTGSATSATCSAGRRRPPGSSTPSVTTRSSPGSWPTPASPRARGRAGRSTSGGRTGSAARAACPFAELAAGEHPRMQFPMEFDWIAPSGRALLTSFMADHYSAGWWMDAAPTLEAAEAEVHRLFTELATHGRDEERPAPGRHRLHAAEQVADRDPHATGTAATSGRGSRRRSRASSSTRSARRRRARGRPFSPQTRDMNPIYTGKDVSFIDTKQAQRIAENTLLVRREVRHDRGAPRRPVPDRGDRQGVAAAAVRRPPRRDHRLRIGPGLPRPARRLARGRGARSVRPRRRARLPGSRDRDGRRGSGGDGLQRAVVAAHGRRPRRRSTCPPTGRTGSSFATSGRRRAVRCSRPSDRRRGRARRRGRRSRSSPATFRRSATGRSGPCRAPTPLDEAAWRADRRAGDRERGIRA